MQAKDGWNAVFWCNHDQPRAVSRFGNEDRYWKESAKMLAGAIHMMRGMPYIYQGEELGMTNHHYTSIEQYRNVESLNYYRILMEPVRLLKKPWRFWPLAAVTMAVPPPCSGTTPMLLGELLPVKWTVK